MRATELDPEYAEPHFGLAQHYLILALFFHMRPRDAMPKALASAERALELDPTDWRGYYVRGVVRATLYYDWTGAAWDLDRAVEVNPLNAESWYSMGSAYFKIGKMAEALEAAKRAVVLNEDDGRYPRLVAEIQERLKK